MRCFGKIAVRTARWKVSDVLEAWFVTVSHVNLRVAS